MSEPSPRREHLRVEPDRLPDPRLWAPERSPFAGPMRRVILFAAGALVIAGASAFGLREASRRARTLAAAPFAGLPALAVEGERQRDPPPKPPPTPEELEALHRSWVGSESIAPRDAAVDAATGERVRPFHGFGVEVATVPAGARILVNGAEVGTSPILTTVACSAGDAVEVRAELGRQAASHTTRCRTDAAVEVLIKLRAGR